MKTWKMQIGSLVAGLVLLGIASPASAAIVTVTTNAVSDTYINALTPTANNNGTYLWFGNPAAVGGSVDTQRTLIGFDLSSIPTYANVSSATLSLLRGYTGDPSAATINAYKVLTSWSEGAVTWSSFNSGGVAGTDYAASTAASLAVPGGPGIYWVSAPLDLSVVQSWVTTPASNKGLFFRLDTFNYVYAWDREHGSPAYLTLTYEYAPEPTTVMLLALGGGLVAWRRRRS